MTPLRLVLSHPSLTTTPYKNPNAKVDFVLKGMKRALSSPPKKPLNRKRIRRDPPCRYQLHLTVQKADAVSQRNLAHPSPSARVDLTTFPPVLSTQNRDLKEQRSRALILAKEAYRLAQTKNALDLEVSLQKHLEAEEIFKSLSECSRERALNLADYAFNLAKSGEEIDLLRSIQKHHEAEELFDRLKEASRERALNLAGLAFCLIEKHKKCEAGIEYFEQAERIFAFCLPASTERALNFIDLSFCLVHRNQPEDKNTAILHREQAEGIFMHGDGPLPERLDNLYTLGFLLFQRKEFSKAWIYLKQATDLLCDRSDAFLKDSLEKGIQALKSLLLSLEDSSLEPVLESLLVRLLNKQRFLLLK